MDTFKIAYLGGYLEKTFSTISLNFCSLATGESDSLKGPLLIPCQKRFSFWLSTKSNWICSSMPGWPTGMPMDKPPPMLLPVPPRPTPTALLRGICDDLLCMFIKKSGSSDSKIPLERIFRSIALSKRLESRSLRPVNISG